MLGPWNYAVVSNLKFKKDFLKVLERDGFCYFQRNKENEITLKTAFVEEAVFTWVSNIISALVSMVLRYSAQVLAWFWFCDTFMRWLYAICLSLRSVWWMTTSPGGLVQIWRKSSPMKQACCIWAPNTCLIKLYVPASVLHVALKWTPQGKRRRGRLKTTWRRTVTGSLPIMLVKCWKVAHQNAKKWLKHCPKSKTLLLNFLIFLYKRQLKAIFFVLHWSSVKKKKSWNFVLKSCSQMWAKFTVTLKSNGTKHMHGSFDVLPSESLCVQTSKSWQTFRKFA